MVGPMPEQIDTAARDLGTTETPVRKDVRSDRLSGAGAAIFKFVKTNLPPFILVAVVWEAVVLTDVFPDVLMPSITKIGAAFWKLLGNGILFKHLFASMWRLLIGFFIGGVLGIGLGLLMGQFRAVEKFCLPLVSALLPIPALAWIPLFVLWFGLGDLATVMVIIFSVVLPVCFNTWTGVKTVNPVWLRAADSMNCRGSLMFFKVIFPASLAFTFTGLRIGLARGWRALVAGEMLASTDWGLGWAIFDSREFLATDIMLVMIAVIGLAGFIIEVVIFQLVERWTVVRWGMVRGDSGG